MTRQEYFEVLNGQYIEMAGTDARNQCVDSVNFYIKWVLGLPMIEWTNAVDFPSKAGSNYEWIKNTPDNAPAEGDLIVWDGEWGHIAVCIKATVNTITSFDQNFPTGSPCHVQTHNYNGVLGWLRNREIITQPIAQVPSAWVMDDQTKIPAALLGEDQDLEIQAIRGLLLDGKRDNLDLQNARMENESLKTEIDVLDEKIKDLQDALEIHKSRIRAITEELKECQSKPPQAPKNVSYSWAGLIDYLGHLLKTG